jgi:hypothetical protein
MIRSTSGSTGWSRRVVLTSWLVVSMVLAGCGSTTSSSAAATNAGTTPDSRLASSPSTGVALAPAQATATSGSSPTANQGAAEAACGGPSGYQLSDNPDHLDRPIGLIDAAGFSLCLGAALVYGDIVEKVSTTFDPSGQWVLNLVLTEEGITLFNLAAAKCHVASLDFDVCPTGRLALLVEQRIISAPTIRARAFARNQIVVGGDFTQESAAALAISLRENPLTLRPVLADLGPAN